MDYIECIVDKRKAKLWKGKPLPKRPKTYTEEKVVSHSLGNMYNPGILTILRSRPTKAHPHGCLFYEIYRDGCFHPFYGRLTFDKD